MFLIALSEFLLFAGFILLLIVSISAPIIDPLGFLNVHVGSKLYRFGAWGMCQTAGNNQCSSSKLGYDLSGWLAQVTSHTGGHSINNSTKANVLLPIACGIAFLATLVAWMSNKFGFFFASFLAFLAFIVSLVIMVVDFAIYGLAKSDAHNAGLKAEYGAAMWMLLGATIALFLACIVSLFQCCCGHRKHHDDIDNHHTTGTTGSRFRYRNRRGEKV